MNIEELLKQLMAVLIKAVVESEEFKQRTLEIVQRDDVEGTVRAIVEDMGLVGRDAVERIVDAEIDHRDFVTSDDIDDKLSDYDPKEAIRDFFRDHSFTLRAD